MVDIDNPEPSVEDEDDHDLLTYALAGERLRDEIATLTSEADGLPEDSEQRTVIIARVQQLQAAVEKNRQSRITEVNRKEFFGE